MKIWMTGICAALMATPAVAQDARTLESLAEQREKIDAFDWADGLWRGEATYDMGGNKGSLIQVERVGDFLDGSVKIVEGRGYVEATGDSVFNALGVIKWHPELGAFRFHTFAQGNAGVHPVALQPDGYDWWIEMGPRRILYETRVHDGRWHEIGYNVAEDGSRTKFFEMTLVRVAEEADWPAPVPMEVGQDD